MSVQQTKATGKAEKFRLKLGGKVRVCVCAYVRMCVCVYARVGLLVCTDHFYLRTPPLPHSLFCMSQSVIKPKSFGRLSRRGPHAFCSSRRRSTVLLSPLLSPSCSVSLTPASPEWSASTRPRATAARPARWASPARRWRESAFCLRRPTNR